VVTPESHGRCANTQYPVGEGRNKLVDELAKGKAMEKVLRA